jgi:uncharacterized membrane protein YdjX (TVP38/TMEM64 family)
LRQKILSADWQRGFFGVASGVFSSFRAKLIVLAVVVLGLALVAWYFPIIPILESLSEWIGSLGLLGLAIFVVLLAVSSLFFFPASPVIITTAAVFGFAPGVIGAVLGVGLGASLGFWLSRSFLRKDIAERLRRNQTFRAIDLAIEAEGWKVVALLRLCPIPFGLANYFYGLTGIRFQPYLWTTILGSLPSIILFCHLGSAGKASLEALATGNFHKGAGEVALLVLSLVATVAALIFLPRFARRAVEKYAKVSIPS